MYYPEEEIPSKKRGTKPKYGDDMIYLYLEPQMISEEGDQEGDQEEDQEEGEDQYFRY